MDNDPTVPAGTQTDADKTDSRQASAAPDDEGHQKAQHQTDGTDKDTPDAQGRKPQISASGDDGGAHPEAETETVLPGGTDNPQPSRRGSGTPPGLSQPSFQAQIARHDSTAINASLQQIAAGTARLI